MNDYTVIGYFENTGTRYTGHHRNKSASDAVREAMNSTACDLVIVEVISGMHEGLTFSEYVERASDLLATEEADEESIA